MSKLVQAGGTAKTTTTAALCVLLARSGVPTHVIDMDPQASLTLAFGRSDPTDRLYHSFTSRAALPTERLTPTRSARAASNSAARKPNSSPRLAASTFRGTAWSERNCPTIRPRNGPPR